MLGLLVCLAMGQTQQAFGQTVKIANISTGGTFTYDGLSFTISGCTSTGISCANADIEAEVFSHRGQPSIEFLGNGHGTGSNALSATLANGVTEDVKFTLTASVILSGNGYKAGTTLTGVSNALAATVTPSGGTVFADATCSPCGSGLSASTTVTTSSLLETSPTFTNQNLSVAVELGLTGNGSSVLTLNNDTLHFSPAPEPASIALLATGLTGLVAMRRRFNRRASTPTTAP